VEVYFSWDHGKARSNLRKHGVDFGEASTVSEIRSRGSNGTPTTRIPSQESWSSGRPLPGGFSWYPLFSEAARSESSAHVRRPAKNAMTTKKRNARPKISRSDDMRPEYDFSKARPNRFAKHFAARDQGGVLVLLEADVAKVFNSGKKVNQFLRAALAAVNK
jgi:hypothetical protein